MNNNNNKKLAYVSPTVTVIELEMEQGIAAGSAIVNPGGPRDEWDSGADQGDIIEW